MNVSVFWNDTRPDKASSNLDTGKFYYGPEGNLSLQDTKSFGPNPNPLSIIRAFHRTVPGNGVGGKRLMIQVVI